MNGKGRSSNLHFASSENNRFSSPNGNRQFDFPWEEPRDPFMTQSDEWFRPNLSSSDLPSHFSFEPANYGQITQAPMPNFLKPKKKKFKKKSLFSQISQFSKKIKNKNVTINKFVTTQDNRFLKHSNLSWLEEEVPFSMNKISIFGLIFGLMFMGALFFLTGFLAAVSMLGLSSHKNNAPELMAQHSTHTPSPNAAMLVSNRTFPEGSNPGTRVAGAIPMEIPNQRMPTSLKVSQAQAQYQYEVPVQVARYAEQHLAVQQQQRSQQAMQPSYPVGYPGPTQQQPYQPQQQYAAQPTVTYQPANQLYQAPNNQYPQAQAR